MKKKPNIVLISNTNLNEGAPLGIGYLHSYLEKNNFSVESIFFINNLFSENPEIIKIIEQKKYIIIGFQVTTNTRQKIFTTIETIHALAPKKTIVIGGIHATTQYKQILHKYPFLIAIRGEGEKTLLELARAIVNKTSLHKVEGLAFINEGKLIETRPRTLITDLDLLPFPKHSLFLTENRRTITSILTSRGCPFKCSFCCLHHISQGKIRFRSINNVIKELEYIKNTFPTITQIWINDDTFLIDNERVISFCNEIIKQNIKFKFVCSARFAPVSEVMVNKLELAGFVGIKFGLESANDIIRKNAHKQISKAEIIRAIQIISKTKIAIRIFLIIGLPGENKETIKETALFVQTLQKIKYIYFWEEAFPIATVFPHIELYAKMEAAGLVSDNLWMTKSLPPLYTVESDRAQLYAMRKEIQEYLSVDKFFTIKGFCKQWLVILSSKEKYHIFIYLLRKKIPYTKKLIKKILPAQLVAILQERYGFIV